MADVFIAEGEFPTQRRSITTHSTWARVSVPGQA
jgi:hypothetical protein